MGQRAQVTVWRKMQRIGVHISGICAFGFLA